MEGVPEDKLRMKSEECDELRLKLSMKTEECVGLKLEIVKTTKMSRNMKIVILLLCVVIIFLM